MAPEFPTGVEYMVGGGGGAGGGGEVLFKI